MTGASVGLGRGGEAQVSYSVLQGWTRPERVVKLDLSFAT
jgi:hypothetical protein